jgi:hypothetical protein
VSLKTLLFVSVENTNTTLSISELLHGEFDEVGLSFVK